MRLLKKRTVPAMSFLVIISSISFTNVLKLHDLESISFSVESGEGAEKSQKRGTVKIRNDTSGSPIPIFNKAEIDDQDINFEHVPARIPVAHIVSTSGKVLRSDKTSKRMATISKEATSEEECPKKKCALLFFGLVNDAFRELTMPSIQRNIVSINPDCDVYIHTYNITSVPYNPRSHETTKSAIIADDAYLLTKADHVKIESVKDFWAKRAGVVNNTKEHYCRGWGKCCTSHINMIKQWHSINQVWDLMVVRERSILGAHNEGKQYYEQVGLFRSDVYFVTPVSIYEHDAGVPDFGHWNGINDRLFYGKREYAKIWSHRFDFVEDFKRKWLEEKMCFHSESYLDALLREYKVSVTKNENICLWRVRSGFRVSTKDCQAGGWGGPGMANISTIKYLPLGYSAIQIAQSPLLKVERDERAGKEIDVKLWNGDLKWPSDPVIDKLRKALLEVQTESSCRKSR